MTVLVGGDGRRVEIMVYGGSDSAAGGLVVVVIGVGSNMAW